MLLDGNYKYIGISAAYHTSLEIITIILLADSLTEFSTPQPLSSLSNNMAAFQGSGANRPTHDDY
jgi:hypothetical protein